LAKKQNKTYPLNPNFLVDQKNIPTAVDLDKYTEADYELPEDLSISKQEVKELLNKEEYDLYKVWKKYNFDNQKLAKKLNVSNKHASDCIYRMKRNLRAAKFLQKNYIASKKIVNYNMNKKIIYFIKKFTEKVITNDLGSLHKYLEHYHKPIPKLDILKTLDYEIRKLDEHKFRLCVPYIDNLQRVNVFTIWFNVDNRNNIKVCDFEDPSNKIIKLNISKQEALKKLKPPKKGSLQESLEEVKKIFKNIFVT